MSQSGALSVAGGGGGGTVVSVNGTPGRITSTGGNTPIIDIDPNYVGQTSITTLGTITTGIWNGSTIDVAHGGTGAVSLTNHGVLLGQGTSPVVAIAAGTAGQVLQSGGAGADPLYSTATYPSTVAQANYLYGSATNVVSALAPTTLAGGFPTYDGTNAVWFNPLQYIYEWDDFITSQNSTSNSKLGWGRIAANGGGITQPGSAQDKAHPGIISCDITTAAGSTGGINLHIGTSGSPYLFGGGRLITNFIVKIPVLSDATDTFITRIGFASQTNGTLGNNGVGFLQNSATNSGNWQIVTSNGGAVTTQNTSTGTDTGWHRYTIDIDAAAANAHFYIDGVELANSPITTNIPTAQPNSCGPTFSILRTAGTTTARSVYIDLFTLWQALTSSR